MRCIVLYCIVLYCGQWCSTLCKSRGEMHDWETHYLYCKIDKITNIPILIQRHIPIYGNWNSEFYLSNCALTDHWNIALHWVGSASVTFYHCRSPKKTLIPGHVTLEHEKPMIFPARLLEARYRKDWALVQTIEIASLQP